MVALTELVALFCGEVDDYGEELSAPFPTAELAVEICRLVRPGGFAPLLAAVFGELPVDEIEAVQLRTLTVGLERWQRTERQQKARALGGR